MNNVITRVCETPNYMSLYTSFKGLDFQKTCKFDNNIVHIKTNYIDPAIKVSYKAYKNNVEDYFKEYIMITLLEFICLPIVILFIYFAIYRRLLNYLSNQLLITQEIMSLLPTYLLLENSKLKEHVLKERV